MNSSCEETALQPDVLLDSETSLRIKEEFHEERQVTVHCYFKCPAGEPQLIRIWKSTFLIDKISGHKSRLLHIENISLFPQWTMVEAGSFYQFTLFFSALPSECPAFDFVEEIPQSGGFFVSGIKRNDSDVYQINIV